MNTLSTAGIRYYRPRVKGPEQALENAVTASLSTVFDRNDWPRWVGGSVPIGAGFPDIVSAWYNPQIISLADFQAADGHILAYLRSVRRAKIDTIADRLQFSVRKLKRRIDRLEGSEAIKQLGNQTVSISPCWRKILPEVVTVEAKVSHWQAALQQANRNRIFAHRSYVALPESVAFRVSDTVGFVKHGVGIISVSKCGDVRVHRPAKKNKPTVWNYYFHLAALAARDINDRSS